MKAILGSKDLELEFVWNRSYENLLGHVDDHLILQDLSKFAERYVDCLHWNIEDVDEQTVKKKSF